MSSLLKYPHRYPGRLIRQDRVDFIRAHLDLAIKDPNALARKMVESGLYSRTGKDMAVIIRRVQNALMSDGTYRK